MVFWDSRTVHYGNGALKKRKKRNFRAVAYLCYTPRELASEETLALKRQAFAQQKTTSHCPHHPRVFNDQPKRFDSSALEGCVNLPRPALCPLGRLMAGYVEM